MLSSRPLLLALTAAVSLLLVTVAIGAAPGRLPDAAPVASDSDTTSNTPNSVEDVPRAAELAVAPGDEAAGGEREAAEVRVVADDLESPSALAFAPDGRLFLAERGGKILVVENGGLRDLPVVTLAVDASGGGGLTGLAVDPEFPAQPYLYAFYSRDGEDGPGNRLLRLRLAGETADVDAILLDDIPAAAGANGGEVKFGPDGLLYVATGDAGLPEAARDQGSLAGKVLRLQRDGSIPPDNPFPGSPVYSLGLRDPRGLAWQPETSRLYVVEARDGGGAELKALVPGADASAAPAVALDAALGPSGAAFLDGGAFPRWRGSLVLATLAGEHLLRVSPAPNGGVEAREVERLYEGEYGRLRGVTQGPDGALYVATSNLANEGEADGRDDRILRVGPVAERPLLYPDLKTIPPSDLRLGTERIDGVTHRVLRFTNMIWNAGEGPLELAEQSETETRVFQHTYDAGGAYSQRLAGEFVFHDMHDHWHFEDFAWYELWTRDAYDAWIAGGRNEGRPGWDTSKTSSCLMDNLRVRVLPDSPVELVYPSTCERSVQGLSVGWADIYEFDLPEQWLDLGAEPLPEGRYVLRSVVDLDNLIEESEGGLDPARDGPGANEAVVAFTLADGRIVIEPEPMR